MRLPIRNSNRLTNWLKISYPNLLSRPQLLPSFTSNQSFNQLNSTRNISFTSSGSSNRASRSRKLNNNNNSNRIKPNSTSSPSSTSTLNKINNDNKSTIPSSSTPLAPIIAHASHGLIQLDSFFAGGKPLLELPIRLSARKTVTPITRFVATSKDDSPLDLEETLEALDGEELVEMVDIAPDGTPLGPSYITTLAASRASEPIRTAEEEEELKDLEREATEAALQDIEEGLSDPYEAWLIAKRTSQILSPEVTRYLASHPPFQLPPSAYLPTSRLLNRISASDSSLSRQTLSDLAFLRPFPSTPTPTPSPTIESQSKYFKRFTSVPVDFATQFVSPLPPSIASEFTSGFLASALRKHVKKAQTSYEATAASLDKALRTYEGFSGRRKGLNERRKKGEVRVWDSDGGWKTVDLGAGNPGEGLFLPAEMVDLDWEDEELERKTRRIGMDSTKRKRKKKITKHKYKKRRKAQTALRQRLHK